MSHSIYSQPNLIVLDRGRANVPPGVLVVEDVIARDLRTSIWFPKLAYLAVCLNFIAHPLGTDAVESEPPHTLRCERTGS